MDPLNVSEYRIQIDIKEIEERNRGTGTPLHSSILKKQQEICVK